MSKKLIFGRYTVEKIMVWVVVMGQLPFSNIGLFYHEWMWNCLHRQIRAAHLDDWIASWFAHHAFVCPEALAYNVATAAD